jgi:hypothetical protein
MSSNNHQINGHAREVEFLRQKDELRCWDKMPNFKGLTEI